MHTIVPVAEPGRTNSDPSAAPLCVDLDGTLIRTDTLIESLFALGPSWQVVKGLVRLVAAGKAAFKRCIMERAALDPAVLPYNEELIAYLRQQKAAGRRLVLATAADSSVARKIADHLQLFDEVIASNGVDNLKGAAKASALVQRFGVKGFAYAGDNRSDLAVWAAACSGITVNAPANVVAAARKAVPIEAEIGGRRPFVGAALRAMRPYQWFKNVLVFVPIFTAHAVTEISAWADAAAMFAAFCATASAVYILNDLFDLAADRAHASKRNRPLASGALPLPAGLALAGLLLCLGMVIAAIDGTLLVILIYAAISLGYSIKLKELPLVDVFLLATLYTIRLFGGGEATGHWLSLWLLGFSSFLFLSLALVKRVEELMVLGKTGGLRTVRRGYVAEDAAILQIFGCGAAFASCVVLALFVQSEGALHRYSSPGLLWGMVPLMLFWQCRLWLSTARGYMHADPIIYAARDWVSWVIAVAVLLLLSAAKVMTVTPFWTGETSSGVSGPLP
jgi:4-hydroxybenzoate polyprenyltransferase/phosphoserine phosphatase